MQSENIVWYHVVMVHLLHIFPMLEERNRCLQKRSTTSAYHFVHKSDRYLISIQLFSNGVISGPVIGCFAVLKLPIVEGHTVISTCYLLRHLVFGV